MDRSKQTFWEMVKPEFQPLHRFCCRLIGSDDDGADLCQDVLVRARTGFGQLKNPDAFRGWLYQIAVNEFKSRIKRPWWARVIPINDSIIAGLIGVNPLARHQASRLLKVGFRSVTHDPHFGTDDVVLDEFPHWTLRLATHDGLSACRSSNSCNDRSRSDSEAVWCRKVGVGVRGHEHRSRTYGP